MRVHRFLHQIISPFFRIRQSSGFIIPTSNSQTFFFGIVMFFSSSEFRQVLASDVGRFRVGVGPRRADVNTLVQNGNANDGDLRGALVINEARVLSARVDGVGGDLSGGRPRVPDGGVKVLGRLIHVLLDGGGPLGRGGGG